MVLCISFFSRVIPAAPQLTEFILSTEKSNVSCVNCMSLLECVCVCVCVCVCACVCACMKVCIFSARVCACMCACMHACVHACVCVYACRYAFSVSTCVRVCVRACVHACMPACVHAYSMQAWFFRVLCKILWSLTNYQHANCQSLLSPFFLPWGNDALKYYWLLALLLLLGKTHYDPDWSYTHLSSGWEHSAAFMSVTWTRLQLEGRWGGEGRWGEGGRGGGGGM